MTTEPGSSRSAGDRWGRYAVTLVIERAAFLSEEPASGPCISEAVPRWRRYDKAAFTYDTSAQVATLSLEIPTARSPKAAGLEARDAIDRFVSVCVKNPGEYEVRALSVEFVDQADPGSRRRS